MFTVTNANGQPVPDGTVVNFTTEGGSIPGSCVTQDGVCSVTFTAQDPRPANGRYDTGKRYTELPETFRTRTKMDVAASMNRIWISTITDATITLAIPARNGQIPPAGTTSEASVTQGSLDGKTSHTVQASNAPGSYSDAAFRIQPDASSGSGLLRITTTPLKARSIAQVFRSRRSDTGYYAVHTLGEANSLGLRYTIKRAIARICR